MIEDEKYCVDILTQFVAIQASLIKSYEVDAEQEEWMFSETEFEYELYDLFLKLLPLVDLSESSFSKKNRAPTKEQIIDCVLKSWFMFIKYKD